MKHFFLTIHIFVKDVAKKMLFNHIIDIGPEGGDRGGQLVACGTPEEVSLCETSYTGQFLREKLS